jgi:glycosyltransferase involved in cell wall biosynthesis
MRVCHVWETFWPIQIGGLERYILWLTNYLAKNKEIDFSLITGRSYIRFIGKNIKKSEDAGFLNVYRLGPSPVDLVNGVFMYAFGSTPKLVEKMKFAALCREAAKWKIAQSADIFHMHGIYDNLEYPELGVYLSQHFDKPLVVTLHGVFEDPSIGGMPLSPAVKSILENAAAITTYSKDVLSVLERLGLGKKSHLITNFVDTEHFKNPSVSVLPHEDTIIYVGRLEQPTTPGIVIEAFKQVNTRFPNAKLHIVGYGSLYTTMKNLIKELNLEGAVSMMGKQKDVRKFLWNSDILVATKFGYISSLEAWSAGVAVVAPNFGVLKETIIHKNNGLLVEPDNVDQLASALISLIEDKELRRKLALNGAQTAKNYDIREVAPKIAEIYRSVIKR